MLPATERRSTTRAVALLFQIIVFVSYVFGPIAAFAADPVPSDPAAAPIDSSAPAPTAQPSLAPTDTPAPAPSDSPAPAPSDTPAPAASDTPAPAPSDTPAPTAAPAASRAYIISFASGSTTAAQLATLAAVGATPDSSIPQLHMYGALLTDAAVSTLLADPSVARVDLDRTRAAEAVPSDASYADQWSLPKIGWDSLYGAAAIAGTARVAVLDTGIDGSHPDLDGVVVPGTSILDGSNGLTDANGHGTAMAGIVAAETGNGYGTAGVAYAGVSVMPVTVLNAAGLGQDSDIIAGVVYAADHGADVILMSFSNPGYSAALQAAIDYAWTRGSVLVAATGNDGLGLATFPAGDRGVVGVASTDQTDALATGSNFGPAAFMAAPGVDILSTSLGGGVASVTGTSAAAAEVAGAAALLKANEPALSNGVIV
ncbi:MAG: S8 family serine peptidase, partial [Chloroflexota bacterium]